jgi:hypothetical protein
LWPAAAWGLLRDDGWVVGGMCMHVQRREGGRGGRSML